jgi:hypothetical protein
MYDDPRREGIGLKELASQSNAITLGARQARHVLTMKDVNYNCVHTTFQWPQVRFNLAYT